MTDAKTTERDEQIEEWAEIATYDSPYTNRHDVPSFHRAWDAHKAGYIEGAKRADANPPQSAREKKMENKVIVYETAWNEIDPKFWPQDFGTIFITINKNIPENGPKFVVHKWVDDPTENVLSLANFWNLSDAESFARFKDQVGK